MFTGIIQEVGTVNKIVEKKDIDQYQIVTSQSFSSDIALGDSIAINGVCLTAYEITADSFMVDVSQETQQCTTFGKVKQNRQVNLEKSLTPSTRMGGHIVSGHVDGIGSLAVRTDNENESTLWFSSPSNLSKYIAVKGSVCIDGVSLTVNEISGDQYRVTIIPHTMQHTTLQFLQEGDQINIEVDLLARYIEQLIQHK